MANDAGLSVMKGASPANIAAAKQAIKDAGYKGEKVVLLDRPIIGEPYAGDGGGRPAEEARHERRCPDDGLGHADAAPRQSELADVGWLEHTLHDDQRDEHFDPAGHLALRANGKQGWFGWPTSEKIETLRQAFRCAGPGRAQKLCVELQMAGLAGRAVYPVGRLLQCLGVPSQGLRAASRREMPLFYNLRRT